MKYSNKPLGRLENIKNIDEMIGKVFVDIKIIGEDKELHFIEANGTTYIFYHDQECCEEVTIEDISGDLTSLIGAPITLAEETTTIGSYGGWSDSFTYTFYKFATVKGYVTVRWYGESNGYYSEAVDFHIEKGENHE